MSDKTIKLKAFRYVLDWFEEYEVEINPDDYTYFQLQCRGHGGDWYLMHHKWNKKGQ